MMGERFSGQLDEKFNPFADSYLAEIIGATANAWARLKTPKHGELEDQITFRLFACIFHDPEFRELPYDVTTQHWLPGLNGERLGRLDLYFKHRHSRRDYFAFEAKRLHVQYPGGKRSAEYAKYVGDAGMMAFLDGQYSDGLPVGGMLAYVMDGLTDKAWEGLAKRIEAKRAPLQLVHHTKFLRSTVANVSGTPGVHLGETEHKLKSGRFRILHLILPVQVLAVAP